MNVRPATPDDVPFIERLQRENRKSVGFLALSWIEGKIKAGQVLIAESISTADDADNADRRG